MARWEWRLLGVLTLGGSFLGLVVGASLLGGQDSFWSRALCLPFLGMYGWGIWCGMRMLERDPRALLPNAWYWALQIPYLSSPVLGYHFASGGLLYVTYAPFAGGASFFVQFGSQFQYSLLQPGQPLVVGINLFAFAVLVWIIQRNHKLTYAAPVPAAPPDTAAGA